MFKNAINTLFNNRRILNGSLKNVVFKSTSKEVKKFKPRKIVIWPVVIHEKPNRQVGISFSEPYRKIKPMKKEKKV